MSPRPLRTAVPNVIVHLADTETTLMNLSSTGVAVSLGFPLPVGSTWPLRIEAPVATIDVTGRVVRCTEEAAPERFLVGLSFVDLAAEARRAIASICDRTRMPDLA